MLAKTKDGRILNLLVGDNREVKEFIDGKWCTPSRPVTNKDLADARTLTQKELEKVFYADQCKN